MWRQLLASSTPMAPTLVAVAAASLTTCTGTTTTTSQQRQHPPNKTMCEQELETEKQNLLAHVSTSWTNSGAKKTTVGGGSMAPKHIMGTFHQLFPLRQLWRPAVEYPLWDDNWDGKKPKIATFDEEPDEGKLRHVILISHGQNDDSDDMEEDDDDDEKIDTSHLTSLGRMQALQTGERLTRLLGNRQNEDERRSSVSLWVSDTIRAKETAAIVAKHLPGLKEEATDSLLNEGRPCHQIPGGQVYHIQIQKVDQDHPRVEKAFRKYFHRPDNSPKEDDEIVIIVGHPNVIRYFLCRALQLPPESYRRYSLGPCSLTYLTIETSGKVSCRTVGDVGHLTSTTENTNDKKDAGFLW